MSDRRSARRRGLAVVAIAGCVLSLAFAVPGLITGAGANVAGPGNVEVSIVASVLTPNLTLSGITTSAPASATVEANGALVIPHSSLTFAPLPVTIGAPNPTVGDVTVQLVASSDFVGVVNPAGHAESLTGRLTMQVTQAGTMTGCPVGPFAVHATTAGGGTRPYDSSTGRATMVDDNFSLPAIAAGASGCGGLEGSLNNTLSLPITTTTTTTVAGSSSSTSTSTTTTTTTLPPTATTSPVSLLPDTPVPSVVLIATITPSPVAANPPTTRPAPPTTIKRITSTTHAPTTSPPSKPAPTKVAPTPAGKKPVAPKVNNHKKHHKKKSKKHHKKHHKPTSTTARAALVPKRTATSTATNALHPVRRHRGYFFGVTTTVAPRPRVSRPAGIPINAALVSSRHRASPSALNLLAILALLVSGWFAVKLVRPDFDDMRRSRSRRRGRLYGIEPRLPDQA